MKSDCVEKCRTNTCNCYEKYGGIENLITNSSTAPSGDTTAVNKMSLLWFGLYELPLTVSCTADTLHSVSLPPYLKDPMVIVS
jgi:hypothetical protein